MSPLTSLTKAILPFREFHRLLTLCAWNQRWRPEMETEENPHYSTVMYITFYRFVNLNFGQYTLCQAHFNKQGKKIPSPPRKMFPGFWVDKTVSHDPLSASEIEQLVILLAKWVYSGKSRWIATRDRQAPANHGQLQRKKTRTCSPIEEWVGGVSRLL